MFIILLGAKFKKYIKNYQYWSSFLHYVYMYNLQAGFDNSKFIFRNENLFY